MEPLNASAKLNSFREDIRHPLECNIELDAFAYGLSSLEIPHIVAIYQEPSEGTIWFKYDWQDIEDEDDWTDIDFLWSEDLACIVDALEQE